MTDLPTSIIINHIFLPIRYFTAIFSFYEALFMLLLLEDLRVEEEGGRERSWGGDVQIPKASFFKKVKEKKFFIPTRKKLLLNFEAVNTCRTIGHTVVWSNSWLFRNYVLNTFSNSDKVKNLTSEHLSVQSLTATFCE